MSHSWSDLTGRLVYDGEPVVTPVISGLFGELRLNDAAEKLTEIQMVEEVVCPSWETVMESLQSAMGVGDEYEDPEEADAALLEIVRTKFGEEAAEKLEEAFTVGLTAGSDPDVQTLCELALLMNDGHNLRGLSGEGAWGGDRIELGCFGGWSVYQSANVSMAMNTTRLCEIAELVDRAADGGAGDAEMRAAMQALEVFAGGWLIEGTKRANLRRQLGEWLLKKAAADEGVEEALSE